MDKVKVCPLCNNLSNLNSKKCDKRECKHVFNGSERGIKEKSLRLVMSNSTPSPSEISKIISSLSNNTRLEKKSDIRAEQGKNLLIWIGFCLLIIGGGALCSFIISPILKAQHPGKSSILFGMGLLAIAIGIIIIIQRIINLFTGPDLKTPLTTINSFYTDGVLSFDYANAWLCLAPCESLAFKSIREFKEYWDNLLVKKLKTEIPLLLEDGTIDNVSIITPPNSKWSIRHEYEINNVVALQENANTHSATFDFVIRQRRIVTYPDNRQFELTDGEVIIPHKRILIKSPQNKWFISSGVFDLSVTKN